MDPPPWRQRRQPLEQFERIEPQVRRAVRPAMMQFDDDIPIIGTADAIRGQRGGRNA